MYGKKYVGIDRCTWLFDEKSVLRQSWRSVKVKGHAAEVLEAVKAL
jgi:peroxiredoxin Q/BCP